MTNYEKAKSEGIERFKKGLCRKYHLNETIVCGHLSNGEVIPWSQDMIVSVLSSFAEKIKEAVEKDAKMKSITQSHTVKGGGIMVTTELLSDSQTIKE